MKNMRTFFDGNRTIVVIEGYSKQEIVPILSKFQELVIYGDVPGLVEHKTEASLPKLSPQAQKGPSMNLEAGTPLAGNQTARRTPAVQPGAAKSKKEAALVQKTEIEPPKFIKNLQTSQNETTKPTVAESARKAETKSAPKTEKHVTSAAKATASAAPTVQSQTQPAPKESNRSAKTEKTEMEKSPAAAENVTMSKQPAAPVQKPEDVKPAELAANTAPTATQATKPEPAAEPTAPAATTPAQAAATPDFYSMNKSALRTYLLGNRALLQRILAKRREFANPGALFMAPEAKIREYAMLVAEG